MPSDQVRSNFTVLALALLADALGLKPDTRHLMAVATSPFTPHPRPLSLKGRGEIRHQEAFDSPSPAQGEGAGR